MLNKLKRFLFPTKEDFQYNSIEESVFERKIEVVAKPKKKAVAKKKSAVKKAQVKKTAAKKPVKKAAKKATKKK